MTQVVDEGSARLNQTHEDVIGLDANHRSMCKFPDKNDNKFIKVSRRLRFEISTLHTTTGVDIKDERLKDLLGLVPPEDSADSPTRRDKHSSLQPEDGKYHRIHGRLSSQN